MSRVSCCVRDRVRFRDALLSDSNNSDVNVMLLFGQNVGSDSQFIGFL